MAGRFVVAKIALFVFACIWTFQVVRRLRSDIRELREPGEGAMKAAIVVIWVLTLAAASWIVLSIPWMLGRLSAIAHLFG